MTTYTLQYWEQAAASSKTRWDAAVRRGAPNPILYRNYLLNQAQLDAFQNVRPIPQYGSAAALAATDIGNAWAAAGGYDSWTQDRADTGSMEKFPTIKDEPAPAAGNGGGLQLQNASAAIGIIAGLAALWAWKGRR